MAQFAVPIAIALVASAAVFILTKPKGQNTKGPRLGDLKVTDSAYGKPIPILRGRGRVGGNIVQASDLREISNTTKVSSGKGGGSDSKQTNYTAEVDFAMIIGEGEIDKILRIWMDGKIVYDITGTSGTIKKPGLVFRFYRGTEDQLPDPLIEALVGENLAPAYRGTAYIIFEKLKLADFGNRPPQVTVEYAEISTPLELFKPLQGNTPLFGYTPDVMTVNEVTRKGYTLRPVSSTWLGTIGDTLLVEFDVDTMLVTRTKLLADAVNTILSPWTNSATVFGQMGMGFLDNRLYLMLEYTFDNEVMVPIDLTTLTTSFAYFFRPSLSQTYVSLRNASMTQTKLYTELGEEWIFNIFISPNGDPLTGDVLTVLRQYPNYTADTILPDPTTSLIIPTLADLFGNTTFVSISFSVAGQRKTDEAEVWVVIGGTHILYHDETDPFYTWPLAIGKLVCRPRAWAFAAAFEPVGFDLYAGGDTYSWYITLDQVDPLAVAWGMMKNIAYVPGDDSLIIIIETFRAFVGGAIDPSTKATFAVKWSNDTVWWSVEVPPMNRGSVALSGPGFVTDSISHREPLDQYFQWASGTGTIAKLDVFTGEVVSSSFTASGTFEVLNTTQYYSPIDESILVQSVDTEWRWVKIYLDRASGDGVAVADIVRQMCLKVGLLESDIDVTGISGPEFEVGGFQATQPSSARANLEPLEVAFSFYSVESDYVIKFISKDRVVTPVDVAEQYLVRNRKTGILDERRAQEFDLPAYVGITFMDQDRDYNTGTVPYRRPSNPSATMLSDNRVEVELPLVWDYSSVKRVAERALYSAWQERVNYKGRMSWDFLYLDPGDEIVVSLGNGDTLPQRIEKQSIGADLTMEFENVSSDSATYSSTAVGEGGVTPNRQTFPQSLTSRAFVLDLPLLSDTHNPPAGLSMDYYSVAGYGGADWRGAILFKSPDNVIWEEVTASSNEIPYGTLATALPDNLDPFITDTVLQLDLYMVAQADQIQSVTTDQLLQGSNSAAVIKTNGEVEVIQFQNAVDEGDGRFTLSNIVRGRRGTNVFCGGHESSELFVLLIDSAGVGKTIPTSEIGNSYFYKAVTYGTLLADARLISHTTQGNDLKPYMPTHFTATAVAGDIQFAWVRNTRIGGDLLGGGDVPLSEDAELYDLELFDAPGGSVVRTFSGVTVQNQLYLGADIASDFGSTPATITFKVYQISALVGRGLSRELTVEVL